MCDLRCQGVSREVRLGHHSGGQTSRTDSGQSNEKTNVRDIAYSASCILAVCRRCEEPVLSARVSGPLPTVRRRVSTRIPIARLLTSCPSAPLPVPWPLSHFFELAFSSSSSHLV